MITFNAGDKVVPLKKTTGVGLNHSAVYKRMKAADQPFLYVIKQEDDKLVLNDEFKKEEYGGDYYNVSDVELYDKSPKNPFAEDEDDLWEDEEKVRVVERMEITTMDVAALQSFILNNIGEIPVRSAFEGYEGYRQRLLSFIEEFYKVEAEDQNTEDVAENASFIKCEGCDCDDTCKKEVLPVDIAAILDELEVMHLAKLNAMHHLLEMGLYEKEHETLYEFLRSDDGLAKLERALENGYIAEERDEQYLVKKYDEMKKASQEDGRISPKFAEGYVKGVQDVLASLGLNVKGITFEELFEDAN
ncbi:hypothetical protein [Bacillus thuringiensis]|uniref:hypothetical protein n=1 Tax=Bacillus thuringiensis TaxID=1428 RepID=UPI0026E3FF9A|nr:hypothetical protein [Bacillus thuringiensis]MDO6628766.1 hypothetical protein [Bacillus thuringiensis]MDO6659314.1 hypothetical protein [Bacillus thuringiensis]MDO6698896.1 hypothetical protein [Bacillus thuringiensis]